MYPKWHIILGAIFTLVLWAFFPGTEWYFMLVLFLSSFLIDFDHYMTFVWKKGSWSLSEAIDYCMKQKEIMIAEQRRGIFVKGDFHLFHTIEFHAFVLALGFVYPVFMYVFAGMIFHSLSDFVDLAYKHEIYRREFFLTNWIRTHLHRERRKRLERIKVNLG